MLESSVYGMEVMRATGGLENCCLSPIISRTVEAGISTPSPSDFQVDLEGKWRADSQGQACRWSPGRPMVRQTTEVHDCVIYTIPGNTRPVCKSTIQKQAHKKHKGRHSPVSKVCHIEKFLDTAPPKEEVDGEALKQLVCNKTVERVAHRSELEDEVLVLHKRLQEELELHSALEKGFGTCLGSSVQIPHHLPLRVQELLAEIAGLEVAVWKLEEQTTALQRQVGHERTEREIIEHHLTQMPEILLQLTRQQCPSSRLNGPSLEPPPKEQSNAQEKAPVTLKEHLQATSPVTKERDQRLSSPKQSLWSRWPRQNGRSQSPRQLSKTDGRSLSPLRLSVPVMPEVDEACASPAALFEQNGWKHGLLTPPKVHLQPASPAVPEKNILTHPVSSEPKLSPPSKRLDFWSFFQEDDHSSSEIASAKFTCDDQSESVLSAAEPRSKYRIGILRVREHRSKKNREYLDKFSSSGSSSNSSIKTGRSISPKRSPIGTRADVGSRWTEPSKNPNRLSEEMVQCMVDIYWHLAGTGVTKSSPSGNMSSPTSPLRHFTSSPPSSPLTFAQSPLVNLGSKEDVMGTEAGPDPYKSRGKLPWADIGPYSNVFEVPWLSVGKEQLGYAAHSLGKFRLLVEQLSKIDPSLLSHDQKLAFWINLYNALLMHAFLAYGIPRSDLKFFSLLQKASYNVGGHSFNAATMEFCLLKGKLMSHRPQFTLWMALHKNKLTEEQSKFAIAHPEPLINFALSCGARSSPMVRVYTAEYVHEELKFALHDYSRAAVGISTKGKLLVPKLLHCYAREVIEDSELLDWVCNFLPISQIAVVFECIQQRRHRILSTRNYEIVPFDFTFRYLLSGNVVSRKSF